MKKIERIIDVIAWILLCAAIVYVAGITIIQVTK